MPQRDEKDEVDLTSNLSEAQIARLSDEKKAELRQVFRKQEKQQHFCDHKKGWQANVRRAASGESLRMPQRDEKNARAMMELLGSYCEPIPQWPAFLTGIPHRSDKKVHRGKLWNPLTPCM